MTEAEFRQAWNAWKNARAAAAKSLGVKIVAKLVEKWNKAWRPARKSK